MDLRKLKTLIDLVAESSISELEITEAEGRVRIVKAPPQGDSVESMPASSVVCSSVVASASGSCSRMSEASSVVSLCAFAVSIASESSGPIALKGVRRTSALALGENVQHVPLENYSRSAL